MPIEVITTLESKHNAFAKYDMHLCFVFDGCDHPMKAETIAFRTEERNKARNELFQFYERGKYPNEILTDNDFTVAIRNVKKINCRSNGLTNLVKKIDGR